jgi:hypothetical protein
LPWVGGDGDGSGRGAELGPELIGALVGLGDDAGFPLLLDVPHAPTATKMAAARTASRVRRALRM